MKRIIVALALIFASLSSFAFDRYRCAEAVASQISYNWAVKGVTHNSRILSIELEQLGPFEGYTNFSDEMQLKLNEEEVSFVAHVDGQGGFGLDRYTLDKKTCRIRRITMLYSE